MFAQGGGVGGGGVLEMTSTLSRSKEVLKNSGLSGTCSLSSGNFMLSPRIYVDDRNTLQRKGKDRISTPPILEADFTELLSQGLVLS